MLETDMTSTERVRTRAMLVVEPDMGGYGFVVLDSSSSLVCYCYVPKKTFNCRTRCIYCLFVLRRLLVSTFS